MFHDFEGDFFITFFINGHEDLAVRALAFFKFDLIFIHQNMILEWI